MYITQILYYEVKETVKAQDIRGLYSLLEKQLFQSHNFEWSYEILHPCHELVIVIDIGCVSDFPNHCLS